MSDASSLSDLALAALITYGPFALALVLLCGGAGVPLPGSIVLVAAGAFAQQEFIQWPWALAAGLLGVVLGDSIAYGIGRLGGGWAEKRFGKSGVWKSATEQFDRRGGWAIFLTRFLITPLGVPVSIIAGVSAYAFQRFLLFDILGEILWIAGYGSVGYALGSSWQTASTLLTDFSGLILGISLLLVGVVVGVRMLLKRRSLPEALQPASAPVDA